MGRDVHRSEIGPARNARNPTPTKARIDFGIYGFAAEGRCARDDLELQHRRDICRRRGARGSDAQASRAIFVGEDLEAVGNGVQREMAARIAEWSRLCRRWPRRDVAGFWQDW